MMPWATRMDLSLVAEYSRPLMILLLRRPRPRSTALTTSVKLLGLPWRRMETQSDSSAPRWLSLNPLSLACWPSDQQPLLGCAFFVAGALLCADSHWPRFSKVKAKFRRQRESPELFSIYLIRRSLRRTIPLLFGERFPATRNAGIHPLPINLSAGPYKLVRLLP